jgi:hypothetical protein
MHAAFPERFSVSSNLARLVEAGTKRFYLPADSSHEPAPPVLDPAVLAQLRQGDAPMTPDQVREQVLRGLADEIDTMLADGVVTEVQDVDLCLLLGAGWPLWLGGITPFLDRTGITGERPRGPFHRGRPQPFTH